MFFTVLLASVATLGVDEAPQWDAFLGGSARHSAATTLPLRWGPDDGIAWQRPIVGHGQSSPVIWGDHVFVTSVDGDMKDRYYVTSFSIATGNEEWQVSLDNCAKVKSGYYVSRAAPTPVVDETHLYVFFESGDLIALTHQGELSWRRSLSTDYGAFDNEFGLAASPCQIGDQIYLLIDHKGPSYLVAIAKKSGETVWKVERESRESWSSPVAANIAGADCIVISSAGSVDAYSSSDGTLLWTYQEVGGNSSNTPWVYEGNRILVGASPGRGPDASPLAKKSNLMLEIKPSDATGTPGGALIPALAWSAGRASSSFGSPILHRGLAYFVNSSGVLHCVDAQTGESVFTERLSQPMWATPFGLKDRVYLFGRDGVTTVIQSGRTFQKLAENRLWNEPEEEPAPEGEDPESDAAKARARAKRESAPILYGYAATHETLLLRAGDTLYCIRPIEL